MLHIFSRLECPIPDRNRHVPDRTIPFPISRNTDFVFPSDISIPDPVLDKKNVVAGMVWGVFQLFPTVFNPRFSKILSAGCCNVVYKVLIPLLPI